MKVENSTLDTLLKNVDYSNFYENYIPSEFALSFITFIKLMTDGAGEQNKIPVMHLDMLDQIYLHKDNLFIAFRGSAKTTVIHEFLTFYIAVYGGLPVKGYGDIQVGMYVSDTMDNGVKNMRLNLEHRYNNSEFLKTFIPKANLTESRWEFINKDGHKYCVRGFGVSSGVRGFKEYNQRPVICGFDDLISDKNSNSPTIMKDIENIVYKAARQALHPTKRIMNWTGTPFNMKDPLFKASESGGWNVRVYPICESYPCDKKSFHGAWEDRFPYEFIRSEYTKLQKDGMLDSFYQELMLQVVGETDRILDETDLVWYQRSLVLDRKEMYNFYITTDFAVSEKDSADYTVVLVWAYSNSGNWMLVDGIRKRIPMSETMEEVFRFMEIYKPISIGIEITGQQLGFLSWFRSEMITRNRFISIAKDKNGGHEGFRPNTSKLTRFNTVEPLFKARKIWFPEELKDSEMLSDGVAEIMSVTHGGIKSRHDDFLDNVTQLPMMNAWKPSQDVAVKKDSKTNVYGYDNLEGHNSSKLSSYIV